MKGRLVHLKQRMEKIMVMAVMVAFVFGSVGCNKETGMHFGKPTATMSGINVTTASVETTATDTDKEPVYTSAAISVSKENVSATQTSNSTEEPSINEEVVPTETPVEVPTEELIVFREKELTPTAEPTATLVPTATPELVAKIEPTSTPEPTATPSPTPTAEPTATSPPVTIKGVTVGDTIIFGRYEQDNNLSNGKEPIEWHVLDMEEGYVFLLSKYVLDRQPYDSNFDTDAYFEAFETGGYDYYITWDKSTIRAWLNDTFFNSAFTGTEKDDILLSELENLPNALRGTSSGPNTTDRVYLLSESEAVKYFGEYYTMIARENRPIRSGEVFPERTMQLGAPAEYAKSLRIKMGVSGNEWSMSYCSWMLRTTGGFTSRNANVYADGYINQDGGFADGYGGIRPCLWIDITTADVEKVN